MEIEVYDFGQLWR